MDYQGIVQNGVIVLDNGCALPEGTRVRLEPLEKQPETLGQRLMRFAGIVDGLPSDMAKNHDHYIHGQPQK